MTIRHLAPLLIFALLVPAAFAEDAPVVSPEAEKVLGPFLKQIESSKSVLGELKTVEQVHSGGEVVFETKTNYLAAAAMPNRFVLKITGEEMDIAIVSDGETLNMLLTPGAYVQVDSPETIDDILAHKGIPEGEIIDALVALTVPADGARAKLLKNVQNVDVAESPEAKDTSGTTLRFKKTDDSVFDLTIGGGETPRLVAARVDMTEPIKRSDRRARSTPGFKFIVAIEVPQWTYDQANKETFTFKPPKDTKAFTSIEALVKSLEDAPHPLIGKSAPEFEAPGMEDAKISLASHKDKDIVILDFWATWCPPCRAAMPVILDVAGKFKDQGVVLYGVNNMESKEKIEEFLKESELDLTVVRDEKGAIASDYQVTGFPMTAIIGRDGVVEAIHLGYRTLDGLRAELTEQLQTLVDGGHLHE